MNKTILTGVALFIAVWGYNPSSSASPCERNPSICNGGGGGDDLKKSVSTAFRALKSQLQALERDVEAIKDKWTKSVSALKKVKKDLDQCRASKRTPH